MELELKLLKEKQIEEEKSGGVGSLFVDEKTPGQHLALLKEKYQQMRKDLGKQVSDLTNYRNELQGIESSVSQKLRILTDQFRQLENTKNESSSQGSYLLGKLESEFKKKTNERLELEAQLKQVNTELNEEIKNNASLKEQTQVKDMESKAYQDKMRIRLGQQEKMIEKLRIDLERITNEIVIFLFIIRKRDKKM